MNQLSNSQCNPTETQGKPQPTTVWYALQFKRNTKTDWLLSSSMVFMQSVSRLLSRVAKLRFSYRMLWRDAYLLQLFPKVALYTVLTWDDKSLHRMKQSDRASPYFAFHGTKRQNFTLSSCHGTKWQNFVLSSCHGADCQRLTL